MKIGILHPSAHRHPPQRLGARARAWVWMLASVMLLATLAPAISRTLDHGKSMAERGWVEVCQAHGLAWVKPDDPNPPRLTGGGAPSPLEASLLQQLDVCGFCTVGIDRSTPPPDFSYLGVSQPLPSARPVADVGLLLDRGDWATWARGPPPRS